MSREKKEKKPLSNRGRDISFVVLLLVSIAAFVNILVLSIKYSSGTQDQAIIMAETYSSESQQAFLTKMNFLREKTYAISIEAGHFTDESDLKDYLRNYLQNDRNTIGDIRYFYIDAINNQRIERNYDDYAAINNENPNVINMYEGGEIATYGIILNGYERQIACFCPVSDSDLTDGIIVFYYENAVLSFTDNIAEDKKGVAEFQAVCNKFGDDLQIIKIVTDKSGSAAVNDSFVQYIKTKSNDGITSETILAMLGSSERSVRTINLQNELYVITIDTANATDSGLSVVSLYKASDVYSEGYDLVITIITTMVVLGIVFLGFVIYFIASRQKMRRRIIEMRMVNPTLNCPTQLKYEKDAKDIFARNKSTNFAVIISHINHFNYITETFGDGATTTMLQHIKETFAGALMIEEAYGYMENGEFVLLFHYKDKERLENRLVSLYAIIKRAIANDLDNYDLKMCYGIYEAEKGGDGNIKRMIEKAMVVRNLPSRSDVNQICHFYNESVRTDYLHRAEIEGRMENALASGEFRVFYQPKYNLERDYIDGAELLVRWYDPTIKKYRTPIEFLPVFEANGFITKLDRHIYYTACETIADKIAQGKRIFPISVNVSRVTAIQPDFLAYYIKVKNHFKIADKFITLEFTESFAYENYEYLSSVVKELRKAGFLCSIDDFGTGYSSYNILKTLEMDEIKMDKFFLDKGTSPERDEAIIKNVIEIADQLDAKITQEGVETEEQLKTLKRLGCSVIQGYFFAKPMSLGDYDKFIDDFFESNKIAEMLNNDKTAK